MPEPLQISVTSGTDKLTQREQIDMVLARAQTRKDALRVRIPVTLYDQEATRGYVPLRDATWNIQLPSAGLQPETVEQLILTIGKCIVAIAEKGSAEVERLLGGGQG